MRRVISCFLLSLVLLSSCQWNLDAWISDDSSDKKEEVRRFDRVVDEFVSLNNFTSLKRMNTEFPHATRLLIEEVLSIGSVHDPDIEQTLRHYYMDSTMQALLDAVHNEYVTIAAEEKELFSVFRMLEDADPDFIIPIVYTQVSGLNQSIIVGDSVLGISLDKYLGTEFPLYKSYYYDYQRKWMNRERLVPDALFYYLQHLYPLPHDASHTLMDYILRYAKNQWILAKCRGVSIEQQCGFTEQDILLYRQYEKQVWTWMCENDYVFTTNLNVIKQLMYARDTEKNEKVVIPGQMGLWIGVQIMQSYMKTHPKHTLSELLYKNDYHQIFEKSGYVPVDK